MEITGKKRLRSFKRNLSFIKSDQKIILAVKLNEKTTETAQQIGFSELFESGEQILPRGIGSVSKFNATGKEIPLTHLPLETHYRQQYWTRKEYRGKYNTREVSSVVDIPYKRYPREYIPPPSVELTIATTVTGGKIIISPKVKNKPENEDFLLHCVNLFLELFGQCEFLDQDLERIIQAPVKKLNWQILPQGVKPWKTLNKHLQHITTTVPENVKNVIEKRFEAINVAEPDFIAVGNGGFNGYVVFGFTQQNIYILESAQTDNATYIFKGDWRSLCQLTKAEILESKLHKERVIHRKSWFREINKLIHSIK